MSLIVYGIPTCDTCKKALKWLNDRDIQYTWIDTRSTLPSKTDIQKWVHQLGNKPLRNTSGKSYRALDKNKESWTNEQWVEAFANDPMLLKRPLFVKNDIAIFTGFRGTDAELEHQLL